MVSKVQFDQGEALRGIIWLRQCAQLGSLPARLGGQAIDLRPQSRDLVRQALVVASESRALLDQIKRGLRCRRRRDRQCQRCRPSSRQLSRAGDRHVTLHGDRVGHGFARAGWTASPLKYEPWCGNAWQGPSPRSDAACLQLPDEIGVVEDVDGHAAIVARDRSR